MERTMNKEIKDEWVARLRSGKYQQGKQTLNNEDKEFCCLGVLCEIAVEAGVIKKFVVPDSPIRHYGHPGANPAEQSSALLPYEVIHWAGLSDGNPSVYNHGYVTLASLNDQGKTFKYIADVIEEEIRGVE